MTLSHRGGRDTDSPPAGLPNARLGSGTIGLQVYGGQTWIKDVRITVP